MSDLIRRKDVIKGITQLPVKVDNLGYTWMIAGDVLKQIDDIPSAEPERKKGKWLVQPSTGDDRPNIWWKCSVCGHVVFSETERDKKEFHAFCGRCGADMRGE